MKTILGAATFALAILFLGCKPRGKHSINSQSETAATDSISVEKKLVETYQNGKVSRCKVDGKAVYFGSRNAPDAGSEVFDSQGNKIGGCYYSTRQLHPFCEQATDCEDIYRVGPNIWGQAAIQYQEGK